MLNLQLYRAGACLEALEQIIQLLHRKVIAQGGELAAQGTPATQLPCKAIIQELVSCRWQLY